MSWILFPTGWTTLASASSSLQPVYFGICTSRFVEESALTPLGGKFYAITFIMPLPGVLWSNLGREETQTSQLIWFVCARQHDPTYLFNKRFVLQLAPIS